MSIFEKVVEVIRDHRMLQRGDRVLIAVSGGADSVALLHLLLSIREMYNLDIMVGHFNHRLRAEESDADERFVEELARGLQLGFVTESLAPADERAFGGEGLESWARNRRYEFFTRVASTLQLAKVALGHTMDDQAETVLLRLIRGSGTLGLAGIPYVREGLFVRPLIHVKREEVLRFLAEKHLPYREDSSNSDKRFLRNRIRKELIPLLKNHYNPKIVDLLSNTAEILREDAEAREF